MKFGQKHSIRKNLKPVEFARGIWNPRMRQWRDVVEDYLYISQKRIKNSHALPSTTNHETLVKFANWS